MKIQQNLFIYGNVLSKKMLYNGKMNNNNTNRNKSQMNNNNRRQRYNKRAEIYRSQLNLTANIKKRKQNLRNHYSTCMKTIKNNNDLIQRIKVRDDTRLELNRTQRQIELINTSLRHQDQQIKSETKKLKTKCTNTEKEIKGDIQQLHNSLKKFNLQSATTYKGSYRSKIQPMFRRMRK